MTWLGWLYVLIVMASVIAIAFVLGYQWTSLITVRRWNGCKK